MGTIRIPAGIHRSVAFRGAFVMLVLGLTASWPARSAAQWGYGMGMEKQLRLSATIGEYRISHDYFESYYSSRWGLSAGAMVRFQVWGVNFLLSARRFRQRLAANLADGDLPPGSSVDNAWNQTMIDFGFSPHVGRSGRIKSSTSFGVTYHIIRENVVPYITSKNRSTAFGFFILLEIEYALHPSLGVGWMVELSSAAANRTAAFEANSVGGIYLGLGLHFYPF